MHLIALRDVGAFRSSYSTVILRFSGLDVFTRVNMGYMGYAAKPERLEIPSLRCHSPRPGQAPECLPRG
jgi:hypothetical protein